MGLRSICQSESDELSEYNDDDMFRSNDNSIDDQDDDSDNETSGTITLIVGNRENEHPSLIDQYLNGIKSRTMVDTGAAASIIHYSDDPKKNRIFKMM